MKIFVFLSALLFSAISHACPDFNGSYVDALRKSDTYFEFKQTGCEQMEMIGYDTLPDGSPKERFRLVFITDGVERDVPVDPSQDSFHKWESHFDDTSFDINTRTFLKTTGELKTYNESAFYFENGQLIEGHVTRDPNKKVIDAFANKFNRKP